MILKQKNLMITILSSLKNSANILFAFIFILSICACNGGNSNGENVAQETSAVTDENSVIIPEDFPAFYAKFHVDPEFQLNHIQFPLSGVGEDERWTAENWSIHKPFSNTDEFKRDMENVGGVITETIMDNNGMFYIVRRFAKLGEDWKLIFYTQGTNLDGFVPDDNPTDQ